MKIWSKTLTEFDLSDCCRQVNADYPGCAIFLNPRHILHTGPRTRYFEKVQIRSMRDGDRDWNTHASWTEWGWWLARLFEIDPDARANEYRCRADFHKQTHGRFLHMPTPRERQIRMEEARAYAHAQSDAQARTWARQQADALKAKAKRHIVATGPHAGKIRSPGGDLHPVPSTHSTPKTRIT